MFSKKYLHFWCSLGHCILTYSYSLHETDCTMLFRPSEPQYVGDFNASESPWQPPPSAAPSLFIDTSLRRHALTEGCLYIICPIQFLISCFRMIVGQFDLGTDWTGSLSWSLPAYSFVPRLRLSCGSGSAAAMVPGVVHGAIPLSLELTAVVACVQ